MGLICLDRQGWERAGMGVAALPALELRGLGLLHDLVAVPVDSPAATRVIGVVRHRSQCLSPVAARFLDFMCLAEIDPPEGARRVA
jgi:LysR family transcriptional regulator, carnitine catabolism transcriptional activator